jgi:hypothetical protein
MLNSPGSAVDVRAAFMPAMTAAPSAALLGSFQMYWGTQGECEEGLISWLPHAPLAIVLHLCMGHPNCTFFTHNPAIGGALCSGRVGSGLTGLIQPPLSSAPPNGWISGDRVGCERFALRDARMAHALRLLPVCLHMSSAGVWRPRRSAWCCGCVLHHCLGTCLIACTLCTLWPPAVWLFTLVPVSRPSEVLSPATFLPTLISLAMTSMPGCHFFSASGTCITSAMSYNHSTLTLSDVHGAQVPARLRGFNWAMCPFDTTPALCGPQHLGWQLPAMHRLDAPVCGHTDRQSWLRNLSFCVRIPSSDNVSSTAGAVSRRCTPDAARA